jgi:prefoldin subunit 5
MEALNAASMPTTPPVTAPVPQVTAPVTTTPTVAPTTSGSNILQTMKNLNWVEIGFGVIGAAALYYAIYYYRYSVKNNKAFQTDFQNKIDDINIKMADVSSAMQEMKNTQEQQQQQNTTSTNF